MSSNLRTDQKGTVATTDDSPEARLVRGLKQLTCFADAPDALIKAIVPVADLVAYNPNDTVIAMGQYDGSMCYGLIEGQARLMRAVNDTGDIDVSDISAGHVSGLATILAGSGHSREKISMVAATAIEIIILDAAALKSLCQTNLIACQHFMQYLAEEVVRLEAPSDGDVGPERRVFRQLMSLVRRRNDEYVIEEMPRHAVIAEAAGVTDRDAAAAIAGLLARQIAVRDYPGLVVRDVEALRSMAY
ncbi:hypothetical protein [Parvularcula sp. LCG005]|uniref:Crp/Fnr family transcriptional regulator n=1 Tax=Parvularcula sp. LCG005 TaxID=3078805 RepID=UPI0029435ED0|nr:hypothetical protein [Parvularcula sp. LCG005]WOI53559.1 hypothetical protein RUI03_00860 [Parvularcula sp. LCG005]